MARLNPFSTGSQLNYCYGMQPLQQTLLCESMVFINQHSFGQTYISNMMRDLVECQMLDSIFEEKLIQAP